RDAARRLDSGSAPLLRDRSVGQPDRARRSLRIAFAYGHETACGVLRRRRTAELLAGGRAARCDTAGGEPAGAVARAPPWTAAPRPLGSAGRADRGWPPALPERAAAARARGADRRRARRGGRRATPRIA